MKSRIAIIHGGFKAVRKQLTIFELETAIANQPKVIKYHEDRVVQAKEHLENMKTRLEALKNEQEKSAPAETASA